MSLDPGRTVLLRTLFVFAAVWTLVWVGVGIWTIHEVKALRQLSETVIQSGAAVHETGDALQGLRALPLVGEEAGRVGGRVSAAGVSAERSGRSSRTSVDRLAVLLGVAIAVAPTVPMLVLLLVARGFTPGEGEHP
jgi:hypothetical protein